MYSYLKKQQHCLGSSAKTRFVARDSQAGFTLIEMMVAVALFLIVMVISVGTLLALIDANKKARSLKEVMNNLNFALDSVTRTIRTGDTYNCSSAGSAENLHGLPGFGPRECKTGNTAITLYDDAGKQVSYQYNNLEKSIERRFASESSWTALTSPDIQVEEMAFYVTGSTPDNAQPTVTISVRGTTGGLETDSSFAVQTTVTQRLIDF